MVVCAGVGIIYHFFLVPSLLGVLFFTDWNSRSILKVSFVGLQNFMEIFTSNKDYLLSVLAIH